MFTDKTGTLTENEMEFQRCSVGGNMYYEEMGQLYLLPDNGDSFRHLLVPSGSWNVRFFFRLFE